MFIRKLTDELVVEIYQDPRSVAVIAKERGLTKYLVNSAKDPMEFARARHQLALKKRLHGALDRH